jgi:uncharacterized protein (TIGR00288 family)
MEKKIAVLIDADNTQYSRLSLILKELSKYGYLITKRAYGDWSDEKLKNWKVVLNELAVQPIQQFAYTTGKNSSDIAMVIDAMDLLYTDKFDSFAIVSSDSDFTKLASRLRESSIYVFGIGERKTPISFKNACDDFIIIDNFNENKSKDSKNKNYENPKKAIGILTWAWENNADDDDEQWAYVSRTGSYIKRVHPDFNPNNYGAKSYSVLIKTLESHFDLKDFGKGLKFRPKKFIDE